MKRQNVDRWLKKCMGSLIGAILFIVFVCFVFDPYFHFHKPFDFVSYRLYDERYTNDGISRHFDFDAMITGTSMAQNFKPGELDNLFGTQSVKETFSGAGYKELSQNLERALGRNRNLRTVIWALDYNGLIREKDWTQYEGYPEYLYDNNPWNDVQYVFNKSVFYHGVMANVVKTVTRQPRTTMDEYSSWDRELGLNHILQSYDRNHVEEDMPAVLGSEEQVIVRENITENIVSLVNKYPDTIFYVFYTPYSICYWDSLLQEGSMIRQFEAEQLATELLLECPNVKLYNFYDQYDIITDLDNYTDKEHYAAYVNSMILEWIVEDEGLVTKDNYLDMLERERQYYINYDYERIYQNQ
ncbi:MAG: hypothetical protein K2M91_13490 [Lachnospiraceae bacterium]|nr:hypothetical protein [Lachnospiraceae bacterium]